MIDALVDLRAYVSAISQKEPNLIKQQAPADIFRNEDPPTYQIQLAKGQLGKPIATAINLMLETIPLPKIWS